MADTHYKDHFSKQSNDYARYRPQYPQELFEYLASLSPGRDLAWDCASGSGQAAAGLAQYFAKVIATDASENQIANAKAVAGVEYQVCPAEQTAIADRCVDLVVVAQALHWFNLGEFYTEVARVLKPKGVVAVWSYNLLQISAEIDVLVAELYHDVLGEFWPPERKLVEQAYAGISFPFAEIAVPKFSMSARWNLDQLGGYLRTWSAVQRYQERRGEDPLLDLQEPLKNSWCEAAQLRTVTWPLALKVGVCL